MKKLNKDTAKRLCTRTSRISPETDSEFSEDIYEGVTEDIEVENTADYRMITRSDDTINGQSS